MLLVLLLVVLGRCWGGVGEGLIRRPGTGSRAYQDQDPCGDVMLIYAKRRGKPCGTCSRQSTNVIVLDEKTTQVIGLDSQSGHCLPARLITGSILQTNFVGTSACPQATPMVRLSRWTAVGVRCELNPGQESSTEYLL